MRYSARWLRWATRVTLQFNLMSGSKWRPMQQDWRSKPRIPKVSNEDADLGITHIGKGAELTVCFWRAHPDRSPQDSRLNQSVLSQEASSDQLVFVIHWGGMTTPRWQTNPKTWSRGGITLEEKKAGGNTTRLQHLNTTYKLIHQEQLQGPLSKSDTQSLQQEPSGEEQGGNWEKVKLHQADKRLALTIKFLTQLR